MQKSQINDQELSNDTSSDDTKGSKKEEEEEIFYKSYAKIDDSSSISHVLSSPIMSTPNGSVYWNSNDLIEAAKLLTTSNVETKPVSLLTDSEQMRRVFTLIYDVLRCKLYYHFYLNLIICRILLLRILSFLFLVHLINIFFS